MRRSCCGNNRGLRSGPAAASATCRVRSRRRSPGTSRFKPLRRDSACRPLALMFSGILQVLACLLMFRAVFGESIPRVWLLLGIFPIMAGLFQFKGGWHMFNRQSYRVCLFGTVAAMLPLGFLWALSMPVPSHIRTMFALLWLWGLVAGIWSRAVLGQYEVQGLFANAGGEARADLKSRVRRDPVVAVAGRDRRALPAVGGDCRGFRPAGMVLHSSRRPTIERPSRRGHHAGRPRSSESAGRPGVVHLAGRRCGGAQKLTCRVAKIANGGPTGNEPSRCGET